MSDDDALGGQTVNVYTRVRGEHAQYRDGRATAHSGCSVQAREPVETSDGGRAGETRRWKLFAPPGFRAASTDQITVVPGPVDDKGAPLRLSLNGTAEEHYDDEGAVDHVTAVLRVVR